MDELTAARAYADSRRWAEALKVLAPVIATRPEDADALLLVAHCRLGLGDAAGALTAADAAGAARPDSAEVAIMRSRALLALRRFRPARAAADRAVQLAPNSVRAHLQRVNVDASHRTVTAGARASADAALRLAPNLPAAHVAQGNVQRTRGRKKAAQECYEEALRLDPTDRAAQYNLAVLHQGIGRWPQAVKLLLGLIRADPADPTSVRQLRGTLLGVLVIALLGCVVAALFVAPRGPGGDASSSKVAVVLASCLILQVGAVVWVRVVVGRATLRFLVPMGRGRWPMRIGIAFVLLGDLALLLDLLSSDHGGGAALAMILFLLALCAMPLSVGVRR